MLLCLALLSFLLCELLPAKQPDVFPGSLINSRRKMNRAAHSACSAPECRSRKPPSYVIGLSAWGARCFPQQTRPSGVCIARRENRCNTIVTLRWLYFLARPTKTVYERGNEESRPPSAAERLTPRFPRERICKRIESAHNGGSPPTKFLCGYGDNIRFSVLSRG